MLSLKCFVTALAVAILLSFFQEDRLITTATASKLTEHEKLAVDLLTYRFSLLLCEREHNGTITGQVCNAITPCIGNGTICPKSGLNNVLCCCPGGQCCDPKAICPGCTRSPCGDTIQPCRDERCLRYPNATCMPITCGECTARFFYPLPVGNSSETALTDVTDICHLPIYPSREPPTNSGDVPPEIMVEISSSSQVSPTSTIPDPTVI